MVRWAGPVRSRARMALRRAVREGGGSADMGLFYPVKVNEQGRYGFWIHISN